MSVSRFYSFAFFYGKGKLSHHNKAEKKLFTHIQKLTTTFALNCNIMKQTASAAPMESEIINLKSQMKSFVVAAASQSVGVLCPSGSTNWDWPGLLVGNG